MVLSETKGAVLTLTLNRPHAMNAFDQATFEALNREVSRARHDASVRVLVLQGAGDHFCAGVDLASIENADEASLTTRTFANLDFARHLVRMEKPVVAKVRGNALGAGFSLALLADFVIAAEDAVFHMPFTKLGAVIDLGSSFMLPRLVGLARAKAIGMLGEKVDGAKAAQWGLIHEAVPAVRLEAAVEQLTARLLELSPQALGLTKHALLLEGTIEQAVEWETAQQMKLIPGEYVQARIKAFRARKRGG